MMVLLTVLLTASSTAAAERLRKLPQAEIVAKLGGMQFTDGVHWREIFEEGGDVQRFDIDRVRIGTWHMRKNELCIDFGADGDDNCFEVWMEGNQIVMQRDTEDPHPREGFLENAADGRPTQD
jgi:hypothetical protein